MFFIAPKDRMWALQRLRRLLSTPGTFDASPAMIGFETSENSPSRSSTSSTPPRGKILNVLFLKRMSSNYPSF